jgi:hypothetical protein
MNAVIHSMRARRRERAIRRFWSEVAPWIAVAVIPWAGIAVAAWKWGQYISRVWL